MLALLPASDQHDKLKRTSGDKRVLVQLNNACPPRHPGFLRDSHKQNVRGRQRKRRLGVEQMTEKS